MTIGFIFIFLLAIFKILFLFGYCTHAIEAIKTFFEDLDFAGFIIGIFGIYISLLITYKIHESNKLKEHENELKIHANELLLQDNNNVQKQIQLIQEGIMSLTNENHKLTKKNNELTEKIWEKESHFYPISSIER